MLEGGEQVYKLTGPALVPVDTEEAKDNVGKRLEFIETQIKDVDAKIDVKQVELDDLGDEVARLQQEVAASTAAAAQAIADGARD
jgi:prefoldin beta subunit